MKPSVKPFSRGPLPDDVVERERLSGLEHGAVDELGGAADVDVAVLRVGEVRRERRHLLLDLQRPGVGGRELGLGDRRLDLHLALSAGPGDQVEERRADVVRVVGDARLGGHHPRLAVDQPDGRVDGRAVLAHGVVDQGRELLGRSSGTSSPSSAFIASAGANSRGVSSHRRVPEDQRHRRRHGRVGEGVERLLHVGLVDVGLGRRQRQLGGLVVRRGTRRRARRAPPRVDPPCRRGARSRRTRPSSKATSPSRARCRLVATSSSRVAAMAASSTITTGSRSSPPVQ